MNTTLKILTVAIPMAFLAGCSEPLTDSDIEVRQSSDGGTGITFVGLVCKADEPIMIESIVINGNRVYYPIHDEVYISPLLSYNRWRPAKWFEENKKTPVVFPCKKGGQELVIAASTMSSDPEETVAVVDATIVTTNRGSNEFTF